MRRIRVILADDHDLIKEGLCRLIEKENDIECVAFANDGEEAVRVVKEFHPDVAIIDIAMPKLNGIEATKRIKKTRPETAVQIVSAYGYVNYVFVCIEGGASGYLLKMPERATLINAIRLVSKGGFAVGKEIAAELHITEQTVWSEPLKLDTLG